MGFPQSLFNKVVAAAQATYDNKNKFYKVDCNANFDLSFKIGTLEYPVAVKNLIYHIKDDICQLLVFQTTDNNIQLVLGNPFNMAFCVIYDYNGQIGFAQPN
jgi:hypothetical protein